MCLEINLTGYNLLERWASPRTRFSSGQKKTSQKANCFDERHGLYVDLEIDGKGCLRQKNNFLSVTCSLSG